MSGSLDDMGFNKSVPCSILMGESSSEDYRHCEERMDSDMYKTIADPIYDIIKIHPLCVKIIDTPQFQRLRDLTQCGVSYMVYPAATHTRFEHSLGVYHLVGEAFDCIKSATTVNLTENDKLCVQIAGLCHDLGHGPFSHSWESFIFQATNNEWRHEDNSVILFDNMIEENQLLPHFRKFNVGEKVEFIKDLIQGNFTERYNDKKFLFQIMANKKTQIDVDKWDYMLRDGFYFNMHRRVDYKRILYGMFVDNNKDIAFRDKVADDIKEIFLIRKIFHKKCYQHRVTKTIDIMLLDALLLADKDFFKNLSDEYEDYSLSTAHKDPKVFLTLSNYIYYVIMHSKSDGLMESREIINRIATRKLYTLISENENCPHLDEKDLSTFISSLECKFVNFSFRQASIFASSGKGSNALEEVKFYDKNNKPVIHKGPVENYCKILIFCTSHKNDIDDATKKEMSRICDDFWKQNTPRHV